MDVGEATGTVTAVSLRTTRLHAIDGTVWHVPNGEIRRVGNKSQHWSRALLDIQVAYGTDIPTARPLIKRVADALWQEQPDIVIEEPEVWGVEQLGPNAIDIRMALKTKPAEQYEVGREAARAHQRRLRAGGHRDARPAGGASPTPQPPTRIYSPGARLVHLMVATRGGAVR